MAKLTPQKKIGRGGKPTPRRRGKVAPLIRALREFRLARGIEPSDPAFKRVGLNVPSIERIESGQNQPNLDTLERYAEAVGFDLAVRERIEDEGVTNLQLALPQAKIIALFNHAGGVGKTSLTRDVGYMLHLLGFRVLLIDMDPQTNLTSWLKVPRPVRDEQTVALTINGPDVEPKLPKPFRLYGLDVIASNLELANLDGISIIGRTRRLNHALRQLKTYDFVLLDSGPSLANLSYIALASADVLIVPMPVAEKGIEALPGVVRQMERAKMEFNPNLKIAAFILTQFDQKTTIDQVKLEEIREICSPIAPVLGPLNDYAIYREATSLGEPVPHYATEHKATEQLRQVTAQLLVALGVGQGVAERTPA